MSKAKKYRIKVIQHLLKNNKIAKSGDVVDGTAFINLQASLDGGYVEEVNGKEASKKITKPLTTEEKEEVAFKTEEDKINSLGKKELVKYAKDHNIEIDKRSKKDVIASDIINALKTKTQGSEEEE